MKLLTTILAAALIASVAHGQNYIGLVTDSNGVVVSSRSNTVPLVFSNPLTFGIGTNSTNGTLWSDGGLVKTTNVVGVPSGAAAVGAVAQADGSGGSVFDPSLTFYNSLSGTNWERGFMRWSNNILQIGGESQGTGTTNRLVVIQAGNASQAGNVNWELSGTPTTGYISFITSSTRQHMFRGGAINTRAANGFGWVPSTDVTVTADTVLNRDGEQGAVAIRGTNTGAKLRVYEVGYNATNFSRVTLGWDSTNAILRPESGGTNAVRVLHISGLPTNDPSISGVLWNSNGTVVVSP